MDSLLREKLRSAISRFPYWDMQSGDRTLSDFYTRTASDFFIMDHNKFKSNFEEKVIDEISNSSSDSYNRETFDFSRLPTTIISETKIEEPLLKHHTTDFSNTSTTLSTKSATLERDQFSNQETIKVTQNHLERNLKNHEDQIESKDRPKSALISSEIREGLLRDNKEILNYRESDRISHEEYGTSNKSKHHSIIDSSLEKESTIKDEKIQQSEEEIIVKVSTKVVDKEIYTSSYQMTEKALSDSINKNELHDDPTNSDELEKKIKGKGGIIEEQDCNIKKNSISTDIFQVHILEESDKEVLYKKCSEDRVTFTENKTLPKIDLPTIDQSENSEQDHERNTLLDEHLNNESSISAADTEKKVLESGNQGSEEVIVNPENSASEKEPLARHEEKEGPSKQSMENDKEKINLTEDSERQSKLQSSKVIGNQPKDEKKPINHYNAGSISVGNPINKKESEHPSESCCSKCELL